jgi:hypothetical protein
MVRTVERIDRELAELDQAIAQLGDEFYSTFQTYFQACGQAMRQQFILAAHHICTQIYPQPFLQLSVSQRQTLQQELLRLVKTIQVDFYTNLSHPNDPDPIPSNAQLEEEGPSPEAWLSSRLIRGKSSQSFPPMVGEQDRSVYRLSHWLEHQEHRLIDQLRQLSWDANRVLQQARILPSKLPEPILEMTIKGELLSGSPGSVPNILDIRLDALKEQLEDAGDDEPSELGRGDETELSLPTESETQPEKSAIGKIVSIDDFLPLLKKLPLRFVAIQMSITDIEFADTSLASQRTRIRQLMTRFNQIESVYRKKLQERTVVSAEDAWKASWFEAQ